jgi:hypothetical protein
MLAAALFFKLIATWVSPVAETLMWGQPPTAVHRAQPECFLIESGKLSTHRNMRHGGPLAPFALQNSQNAAVKPDTDPISML